MNLREPLSALPLPAWEGAWLVALCLAYAKYNSPDGTGDLVETMTRLTARVRLIRRAGKLGLGSAYVAGFHEGLCQGYRYLCEMDADFSRQPRYLPVLVAMISALPAYVVGVQLLISLVGLYEFTAVHRLTPRWYSSLWLIVAYLPYQWMLGFAALRAAWRHLRGMNNWEKTRHVGAHRVGQFAAPAPPQVKHET